MLLVCLAAASPVAAQWRVMPMPLSIQAADGQFAIGQNFRVGFDGYSEPRLDRAASRLTARIATLTGMMIPAAERSRVCLAGSDRAR